MAFLANAKKASLNRFYFLTESLLRDNRYYWPQHEDDCFKDDLLSRTYFATMGTWKGSLKGIPSFFLFLAIKKRKLISVFRLSRRCLESVLHVRPVRHAQGVSKVMAKVQVRLSLAILFASFKIQLFLQRRYECHRRAASSYFDGARYYGK